MLTPHIFVQISFPGVICFFFFLTLCCPLAVVLVWECCQLFFSAYVLFPFFNCYSIIANDDWYMLMLNNVKWYIVGSQKILTDYHD